MDRRDFVRLIGAGGLIAGVGALMGVGCAEQPIEETAPVEPPPPEPDAADNGGEETQDGGATDADGAADSDEAAASGDSEVEQLVAKCPNCGAENEIEQWGEEVTCWKCGHKWTPQEPA